jgi:hypothetical protein
MLKWRFNLKNRLIVFGLIAAAALLAAPRLSAQGAGTLKEISFSREDGKTVILIKVDGRFSYETSTLSMPRRMVVDLSPVDKITAPSLLQVDEGGVRSVRTGQFKPDTARVVFELTDQNPAQSMKATENELRISFWLEGDAAAAKQSPAREIPREEVGRVVGDSAPAGDDRFGFFFRAGVGVNIFLKSDLATRREFTLYGETGAIDETYTFKTGLAFDGSVGRYFRLGGSRLKAGLGFTYWRLPAEGAYTLTLPHPLLTNTPRTVNFSDTTGLKTDEMSFYGYALFSLVDTENFSVFIGPFLGFVSGKFLTLSDWDITEKAPFSAADVTVSNTTTFEDTVSEFLFGASLSMELNLGRSVALVLDTKLNYLNPIVTNLGKRANLLHVQPMLGIQFNF